MMKGVGWTPKAFPAFRTTPMTNANPLASRGQVLLGLDIRPENGIHARQMALASAFEPVHHVCVQAQMYGGLSGRHDHAGATPKVCAKRFGFGSIGAGLVLSPFAHGLDLAKGASDDGRCLVHLCSLSGR